MSELLNGSLATLAGPGSIPTYPPPPHCNQKGLTDLGDYVLRQMVKRHFLIEIDHMSSRAAAQALSVVESEKYSGVMSSHTWANDIDLPRVRALGGSVTPYAGSSTSFAAKWRQDRAQNRSPKYRYSIGYGADMNGLGAQGPPRPDAAENPVVYPFKSGDGAVTFDRQVSGERTYDINVDGVAHYGLYPDWLQDLRVIAGPKITRDLFNGAEGYLEMWERADGITPGPKCPRGAVKRRGVGKVRLGMGWKKVLRRAGQPWTRPGKAYRFCHGAGKPRVGALMSRRGRVLLAGRRGARVPAARRSAARRLGSGVRVAPAGGKRVFVFRGRKTMAVAKRAIVRTPKRARRALRAAGL